MSSDKYDNPNELSKGPISDRERSGAGPDESHIMDIFLGEDSLIEIVLVSNTLLTFNVD